MRCFDKYAGELKEMKVGKSDSINELDVQLCNYIASKVRSRGHANDDESMADSSVSKQKVEYKYVHDYETLFGTKLDSLDYTPV